MSLSPELMKAILSMDAYNRGYDAGIVLTPSTSDCWAGFFTSNEFNSPTVAPI